MTNEHSFVVSSRVILVGSRVRLQAGDNRMLHRGDAVFARRRASFYWWRVRDGRRGHTEIRRAKTNQCRKQSFERPIRVVWCGHVPETRCNRKQSIASQKIEQENISGPDGNESLIFRTVVGIATNIRQ